MEGDEIDAFIQAQDSEPELDAVDAFIEAQEPKTTRYANNTSIFLSIRPIYPCIFLDEHALKSINNTLINPFFGQYRVKLPSVYSYWPRYRSVNTNKPRAIWPGIDLKSG